MHKINRDKARMLTDTVQGGGGLRLRGGDVEWGSWGRSLAGPLLLPLWGAHRLSNGSLQNKR